MLVSIEKFREEKKKFLEKYLAFDKKFFDIENDETISQGKKNELLDELYDTFSGYTSPYDFEYSCIMNEGYINNSKEITPERRKFFLKLLPHYGEQINDVLKFVGIEDAFEDFYYVFQDVNTDETIYRNENEKEINDLLKEKFNL